MSWHTELDGTMIVSDDCDHSRSHIGFQMGTVRRLGDGKLVHLTQIVATMLGVVLSAVWRRAAR